MLNVRMSMFSRYFGSKMCCIGTYLFYQAIRVAKLRKCRLERDLFCHVIGIETIHYYRVASRVLIVLRINIINALRYSRFIGLGRLGRLGRLGPSMPRIQGLAQQHKMSNFQGQAVHGRSSAERTYRNKTDAAARSPTKTAETY